MEPILDQPGVASSSLTHRKPARRTELQEALTFAHLLWILAAGACSIAGMADMKSVRLNERVKAFVAMCDNASFAPFIAAVDQAFTILNPLVHVDCR